MPDYKNGKIYKLSYDNLTYYGSTATTLKERMWSHKGGYKQWKAEPKKKYACFDLFDKYGIDNFTIELVENYPCDTKKELFIREQYYIDNFECVNEIAAYTSEEVVKEQKKQWYEDNKEAISEKKKQKIVCECGKTCRKSDIAQHRKTAFHLSYLNNLSLYSK